LNKLAQNYIVKFLLLFSFFYFGTSALIGVCTKGGYYISFADEYLDYVSLLRKSILLASKFLLGLLGYKTEIEGEYVLTMINGKGVRIVYSCLAYGVMSFWAAFVIANNITMKKKIFWVITGIFSIWLINVIRIAALVLSRNNIIHIFKHVSHHTMFNIVAYGFIFFLIYLFDRNSSWSIDKKKNVPRFSSLNK
jgi:exosortase/archaeosortase family protein